MLIETDILMGSCFVGAEIRHLQPSQVDYDFIERYAGMNCRLHAGDVLDIRDIIRI